MSFAVIAVIGVVAILVLVAQATSATDTGSGSEGCSGNAAGECMPKFSLDEGATRIAGAMAGFETGTLADFDPNNTALWKGQAQRNNNPGNLRGINGTIKQFQSPGAGFSAMISDIKSKIQGRTTTGLNSSSSIFDLINVWAPVGENSQASVNNYIAFVAGQVGVEPNAPFNSYIEV